jgi:hypothetical protein
LTKERDKIQHKLENFIIYQQYLEKVLENAEEVSQLIVIIFIKCSLKLKDILFLLIVSGDKRSYSKI